MRGNFWNMLEKEDLPEVFQNVKNHLKINGDFIGSIPLFDDVVNGVSYHPTIKLCEWWKEKFAEFGFEFQERHPFGHHDFARRSGNMEYGLSDYDIQLNPEPGFHLSRNLSRTDMAVFSNDVIYTNHNLCN